MPNINNVHAKKIVSAGSKIQDAEKVLFMMHGRGGSAEDILSLASYLDVKDFALFAPQATNNSWYPNSFMVPPVQNEPWLSSALSLLKEMTDEVIREGVLRENIYFLGFSQGACLTLEFVTRNATKFGGIVAFTGGLIGDKIYSENYRGDFENTRVFIGSSDPDPHVPVERVYATTNILEGMNANVTTEVYKNRGHTITQSEIDFANQFVFGS